jgi:hypothetical protein
VKFLKNNNNKKTLFLLLFFILFLYNFKNFMNEGVHGTKIFLERDGLKFLERGRGKS